MKVAIIGCGEMGSGFARHFSKDHSVILCDIGYERSAALAKELGAEVYARHADAVQKAELVILAVKPKDLQSVAKAISREMGAQKTIVSVLAGVSLAVLKHYFPSAAVVRMMPNLAMTCGKGVIGLVDDPSLSETVRNCMINLFQDLGLLVWLAEEKLNGLTALTGSGPAFLFVLIEAMIDSGILLGFGAQQSKELILEVLEGSVAILRKTNLHPGELKWKVASPEGTTISGLHSLEKSGLRAGIMEAFMAAYERAKQMQEQMIR